MEIKIDTGLMQQMAQTTKEVRNLIEEAMVASEKIVVHNDWNCKERDLINEEITKIKKDNQLLNDNIEEFSSQILNIADKFVELDNSLIAAFSECDLNLGELVSDNNMSDVGSLTTTIVKQLREEHGISNTIGVSYWDQYHINAMDKPISQLTFDVAAQVAYGFDFQTNMVNEEELAQKMLEEFEFELGE